MMLRGIDFRALECFVVLAEELHFRRAAERLNMTQPSLSARVKTLEEEVGAVLLDRDRRNVRLTAAGAIFLEFASSTMARTEEAVMSARRAAAGESGRLRFGFTGLTTYDGMPELVQLFRARFPGGQPGEFARSAPDVLLPAHPHDRRPLTRDPRAGSATCAHGIAGTPLDDPIRRGQVTGVPVSLLSGAANSRLKSSCPDCTAPKNPPSVTSASPLT